MHELNRCPICGCDRLSTEMTHVTKLDERVVVKRCHDCRHRFVDPQPSFEELAPYYDASYSCYQTQQEVRPEPADSSGGDGRQLRHVTINHGIDLLDFGCGAGDFLLGAKRLGASAFGIEPGSDAVECARSKGLNVFHGSIDEYLDTGDARKFDLITANHVIEHVPDPVDCLAKLSKLLKTNGRLWIAVPNVENWASRWLKADWHSADLPRHIHHFNLESAHRTFSNAGLKAISLETLSLAHSTACSVKTWLRRRFLIPETLSSSLRVVDEFVAPAIASRCDKSRSGEALLVEGTP